MASGGEISNYPFLTQEEFGLACHLLDLKYIAATLGQERRNFRLRLQQSMISDSISVSIARPIDISKNDISLSLDLAALSWGEENKKSNILMDVDAEDGDSVSMKFWMISSNTRVCVTSCAES
jgi:ubiquitin-like-conjugating enzyme ATG10